MGKYEQTMVIKESEWDLLNKDIMDIIEKSLLSGNPDPALRYGAEIVRQGRLKGVKLAKLLYELDEIWTSFDTGDVIEDAIERDMGIPKDTFLKYSRMYRHVLVGRPELAGKPIAGLIKLTAGARDGDFSDADWNEITMAHNQGAMIEVRDRARDIHTSGHNRLNRWLTRDGQLMCTRGPDGEIKQFGLLYSNSQDEDVRAACETTLHSGIREE